MVDIYKILERLKENSLKASFKKCYFFRSDVTFLGFDISKWRLKMNKAKIDTLEKWPLLKNVKELRKFLGFINFYRRFITHFSEIAGMLTTLTRDV